MRVYPLLSSLAFSTPVFAQFIRGSVKNSPRLKSLMCMSHQLQTAPGVSPTFAFIFLASASAASLAPYFYFSQLGMAISVFKSTSIQFHALQPFFFVSNPALQLVQRVDGAARVAGPADGAVGPESGWLLHFDAAASVTKSADDLDNAESV